MKKLKSFDLFEKINQNEFVKPTLIGALLSIISILIIVYLIVKETIEFFGNKVIKESIVINENSFSLDSGNKLKLYISLLINSPCSLLSLDVENIMGKDINVKHNINKTRLDKLYNNIEDSIKDPHKLIYLEKTINDDESCLLNGEVFLNKTPGDINISYNSFKDVLKYLKNNKPILYSKLRLNHRISIFNFGNSTYNQQIKNKFDYDIPENIFPNYLNTTTNNYEYYISIIPYLFIDENNKQSFMSYFYSVNTKHSDDDSAIIIINYDISPIAMKISIKKRDYLHFITHICAIVGGTIVIFRIINNCMIYYNT